MKQETCNTENMENLKYIFKIGIQVFHILKVDRSNITWVTDESAVTLHQ